MAIIIGVRFREIGRVYYFDPGEYDVNKGDRVIVETARGVECGEVAQGRTEVPDEEIKKPLKPLLRIATEQDLANVAGKAAKEAEAFKVGEEKIAKHALDMKLVNVEYTFDGSKIVFNFTADQRVDFRALVRDLASSFRTRIELRQIGVRDEAKLLGGLGICGRPFCCSTFMGDFHPVSINMAKGQGLSLNPSKISGTCGRLMCCLKYEETAYADAYKTLPRVGSTVETPEGPGRVTELNAVSQDIKVKLESRMDGPPVMFRFDNEKGVVRKPVKESGLRDNSLLGELDAKPLRSFAEPVAPPRRAEQKPRQPRNPQQQRNQQPRNPEQKPAAQRSNQPPKPATEQSEATRPQQSQGQGQAPRNNNRNRNRNRNRNNQNGTQKPQQQSTQQPAQQAKQTPAPAPQPQQAQGEIRRANAPKPEGQQQSNRRQPWHRNRKKNNNNSNNNNQN
ncbi:MAG: stage 0 sporulation family protein [Oscillospiraceae bacterium]|nr:stage 0 sporulation family protein [Oscillospiraceae bacterium]